MSNTYRMLYCPICGKRVRVEVPSTKIPEVHVIPDHRPKPPVNLCAAYDVVVTFQFAKCRECGCNIAKHPSGLCLDCFSKGEQVFEEETK